VRRFGRIERRRKRFVVRFSRFLSRWDATVRACCSFDPATKTICTNFLNAERFGGQIAISDEMRFLITICAKFAFYPPSGRATYEQAGAATQQEQELPQEQGEAKGAEQGGQEGSHQAQGYAVLFLFHLYFYY
jgi:hypothetical protein